MSNHRRTPAIERFWALHERTPEGCWKWTGYTQRDGYGRFFFNGRPGLTHRFAYATLVGPIPDGMVLDHLCRNSSCVNPAHLEPVTNAENLRRGVRGGRQPLCSNGHEYTAENTQIISTTGTRRCRVCHRENERKRRAAQRSAA